MSSDLNHRFFFIMCKLIPVNHWCQPLYKSIDVHIIARYKTPKRLSFKRWKVSKTSI
ncbi:hypothetical protein SCA05_21470 [Staphylococcus carnosus]|nr:hypothetical protein SCA05_21470 [Staphylococcus carnosus]